MSPNLEGRCPRCWVMLGHCVCAQIPSLPTTTRLLVVRHVKERHKSTNTARLASLALPAMSIVDYGVQGSPFDEALLAGEDTWALFPGGGSALTDQRPKTLVILDGTWAQARQMSHRIAAFGRLPRLSLEAPLAPALRLRRPPHPEGMSTLEAIALALGRLEGDPVREALLRLHDHYVRAVLGARGQAASSLDCGEPA